MWTKEGRVSNYGFCLVRWGPKRLGFLTMGPRKNVNTLNDIIVIL